MPIYDLKEWGREFRLDAKADNLALFSKHLQSLSLPDKPKRLLEGTVLMVVACCAYMQMDGVSYDKFITMQKYNPADARNAKYAFTFELGSKAFARILVPKKSGSGLDLADLYDHPWEKYKTCGYNQFWVSRTNGKALTAREKKMIENEIAHDLFFDYSEDEIEFCIDDTTIEGVLSAFVYDVHENDI
ncbi:MAG: hypothetical protein WBN66_01090 [Smithella sp.]